MKSQILTVKTIRVCSSLLMIALAYAAFANAQVFGQGFLVERASKVTVAPDNRSSTMIIIEPVEPRPLPHIRPTVLPTPATQYRVESETISATINGSIAKVQVEQTFRNEGKSILEAFFVFPLPYDGAVDSLTMLVNGKEIPAQILDAKDARAQYEEIVRKTKDPALLECLGNGMFKTSVFPIPPGETQTIQITYSQILKSSDGLVEFAFPMSASQFTSAPIGKVKFDVTIIGDSEIKNVYSPTYDLKIDRNGAKVVNASAVLENKASLSDFRLFFDQNEDDLSAKIQSYRPDENDDGYFLMLASPKIVAEESKPLPKTIVFAIDVSGSMTGQKIAQARDSLAFVLSRLAKGDKFNIVLFNGSISSYRDELQTLDEDVRADALAYVAATRASGSTNISGALERAFALLNQDDSTNPKYLVFLSDGEATTGETNEMKLAEIARNANKKEARFFSFGVGYDVHSRLLDRFVSDGRGQGVYVKPNENIEEYVAKLYSRIEAPIFTETTFNFKLEGKELNQYFTNLVYPSGAIDVFAGEQIVVVGRYSTPGDVTITAKGRVGEKDAAFTYSGKFVAKSEDSSYAYVARLWANRRVAEIIDQLDLKGQNKELLDELVELSKKHGIITPYTSFFAGEEFDLNDSVANEIAERQFNSMASQTSNQAGFGQRAFKQNLRNAANVADSVEASAFESLVIADSAMGGGFDRKLAAREPQAMRAPRSLGRGSAMGARSMNAAPVMADADVDFDDVMGNSARDAAQNVRHIGNKTFYFKKNVWVDSSITDELRQKQKKVELTPYSDEYFRLVAENGREFGQYLVFGEGVELNYNGTLYILKPQSND